MSDADVLKEQSRQAHEWLMANGTVPHNCGTRFYISSDRRGDITSEDRCDGIKLFSGALDLWWLLTYHSEFATDLRSYTKIVLAGPLEDSGVLKVMTITSDLTRDVSGFAALAIDPKRIAELLVGYLNRTAGTAHQEMKRYCFDLSNLAEWGPDQGTASGCKMAQCYRAMALVKASSLWCKPSL